MKAGAKKPRPMARAPRVELDATTCDRLFPFGLSVDRHLRIVRVGSGLQRLVPELIPGDAFERHFSMVQPTPAIAFEVIAAAVDRPFLLAAHAPQDLLLRGLMRPMGDIGIAFLGSPHFVSPEMPARLGIVPSDFGLNSAADLLVQMNAQRAALVDAQSLSGRLRDARDAAIQASQIKTQFLANMSHELRTPLNAILGFSEALTAEIFGPIPERYRSYIGDIHVSGQLLQNLIGDLLDLSRIEAGRLELDEAPAALVGLMQECVKLVSREARRRDIRIEFGTRRADPVVVYADARALKQVFLNVLSNAVKFSDPHGVVTVVLQQLSSGDIEAVVIDAGVGIPADVLPHLFEPFRQADSTIARKYGGTGLGLSICKRLVELHDGTIAIESSCGVGTKVVIRLPAQRVLDSLDDEAMSSRA